MRIISLISVFALLLYLFSSCSKHVESNTKKIIYEPMKLELTFGDEDTLGEYLLALPSISSIAVNGAGDIFVVDEDRVKLFDKEGKPKMIIGRRGQGPGEFERVHSITISETGYITVSGGPSGLTFHVFSPEYKFIKRYNYMWQNPYKDLLKKMGLNPNRPKNIVSFGEKERFFSLDALAYDWTWTGMLLYEKEDALVKLVDYPLESYIETKETGIMLPFLGLILHAVLPGKRVVYTHTAYDSQKDENGYSYKLHIVSLDDFKINEIIHPYEPVEITNDDISKYKERIDLSRNDREKGKYIALYKAIEKRISGVPYKASLNHLTADGKYIFAFTYKKNDKSEVLTDIFDADSGQYLSSAYFPTYYNNIPAVGYLKNGYSYRLNDYFKTGVFAKIEVHSINPALYGK